MLPFWVFAAFDSLDVPLPKPSDLPNGLSTVFDDQRDLTGFDPFV